MQGTFGQILQGNSFNERPSDVRMDVLMDVPTDVRIDVLTDVRTDV